MPGSDEIDATSRRDLRALAAATQAVYERNAGRFDAERPKRLHERAWLERFAAHLPTHGTVLDLGCGAGEPIAAHFARLGYRVTGVDFSTHMLDLARARAPQGDWRHADMRSLALGTRFNGIIGWNSFFHLTPDEQRSTLPRLADHLRSGGVLMLTVGPEAGEVVGRVGDDRVYHASLSPQDYETILGRHGLTLLAFVKEDPDCDFQTVLIARRGGDALAPEG